MKKLIMASLLSLVTAVSAQADIITQWNFNGQNSTPSTGTGTIGVIGGATISGSGFNSGSGSSDPTQPGFGFQTTSYPGQGVNSGTAGILVGVSTLGFTQTNYSSLEFSFDLRTSNTSSRWFRADWSADSGTTWNLGMDTRMGVAANAGDSWHNGNLISITDSSIFDNAQVQFRVVSVFSPIAFTEAASGINFGANTAYEVARNTTSNYGGGTWRFDMVTVSATAVPEPTSMALLGVVGLGGLVARRFRKKKQCSSETTAA